MKIHIASLGLATVLAAAVSPALDYGLDSLTGTFGEETVAAVKAAPSTSPAAPVAVPAAPSVAKAPAQEKPVAPAVEPTPDMPAQIADAASPSGDAGGAPSVPVVPSLPVSSGPSVEEESPGLPEAPSLSSVRDSLGSLFAKLGATDSGDSFRRNSFRVKYLSGDVSHEGLSISDVRRGNHYYMPYHERKDDMSGYGAEGSFFFLPWLGVEASALHVEGRLKSGSIHLGRGRYYFEDSKTRHTDLKAGVFLKAFPDRTISPFAVVGVENCKYKTDYAYTVTYWYWTRSGNVSRARRNNRHGDFDDGETGLYADVGLDCRFGRVRAKAGASIYNVADSMDSAWEENHHASPVCPFAEVSVALSDRFDVGVEYSEIPVSDFKYYGVSLGVFF